MTKKTDSGLTLFLMELMLTILLFSICAAICVGIFSNAWLMAESNDNRNHAMVELRNVANCYKAAEGDLEKTGELYGGSVQDNVLVTFFDSEWVQNDSTEEFMVTLSAESKNEAVATATKKDGTILGRIAVKTHSKGGNSFE